WRAKRSSSAGSSSRCASAAISATRSRVNSEGMANASMLIFRLGDLTMPIRRAAVAGSWYPGSAAALSAAVDAHLQRARPVDVSADVVALIAPHAGLVYSGPVAAYAYALLHGRPFETAVLIGPSHFIGFDGAAVYESGAFETPFGALAIDEDCAAALLRAT